MRRTNGRTMHGSLAMLAGASLLALGAGACSDATSVNNAALRAALSASLSSAPAGFGTLSTSFVGAGAPSAGNGDLWIVGGRFAEMDRGAMMGGGIGDAFVGAIGRGRGFGWDGPFGGGLRCNATFDTASGRLVCPTLTLPNGLTVTRSASYADASGTVQQAFDSLTTDIVNLQSSVSGTVTYNPGSDSTGPGRDDGGMMGGSGRRGGRCWGDGRGERGLLLGDTAKIVSATTTIASTSNRTVSGLASGSTQRTVNGTANGTENTTGSTTRGDFTASRITADTTTGLVIPIPSAMTGPTYPKAGTVIRVMQATLSYAGSSPTSISRREVVTYDGSATAKVVITQNDSTKNCTKPLPRGPLSCS